MAPEESSGNQKSWPQFEITLACLFSPFDSDDEKQPLKYRVSAGTPDDNRCPNAASLNNDTELKSRSSQWNFEVCPSQEKSYSITYLDRISFPALTLESITMKVF